MSHRLVPAGWPMALVCTLVLVGCADPQGAAPDGGADASSGACVPHDASRPTDAATLPPGCLGTARPCATLTASDCTTVMGCSYAQCAGVPLDCHNQADMAHCLSVVGCTFERGLCGGAATSCGSLPDETACGTQTGCAWSTAASCSGVASRCDLLPAASCTTQPGCMLGPPDMGLPDAWAPPPDAGPTEWTTCGGDCVDLLADEGHCGACATVCGASEWCAAGVCRSGHGCESCRCFCAGGSDVVVLACAGSGCGTCDDQCWDACSFSSLIGTEGTCW